MAASISAETRSARRTDERRRLSLGEPTPSLSYLAMTCPALPCHAANDNSCLGSAARGAILIFEFRLVVLLQRHYVRGVSDGALGGS